ncbi:excinuclease ABC subunit UvrA [Tsukamurella sp. NPDC003166]|uniref:excinuclease ABC subunit UvrA n=1 Tax=Tsukamurella sp. NPDC003166 TaxID=3154444 RepID=UPI0033BADAD9
MTDDTPLWIAVRGARVHNLRSLDVDVPLRRLVAIAGVSGSGKSSLAMGVLYAEGSRRYLEALSTYTRRRMAQAPRAAVDSVEHVPAALALRQRPGVPGVRSTFGTSTELLNVLRLMFSRLAAHRCPNGHYVDPTIDVAAGLDLTCPECGAVFSPPGAEALAFNADGACPTCAGTGTVRAIDGAALVPDPTRTIADGAVAPWSMMGLTVMPQVVAEMGVRTDVPFDELTDDEKRVVLHGPAEKRHITVPSKNGKLFELNFTYRNATTAVQEALDKADTESGLGRIARFLHSSPCPDCRGTRLNPSARAPRIGGLGLADVTAMTLDDVVGWAPGTVEPLPADMREMAGILVDTLESIARRLLELGLGYLGLDRAAATLSTGERQRVQLARAVRNRTTGVLYVLDEPSVGLHPANVEGLLGVVRDLLRDGNSVVVVDHDLDVVRQAEHLVEIGPGSGSEGGRLIAQGAVAEVERDPNSVLGDYLAGRVPVRTRPRTAVDELFARGRIHLETNPIHTVHALAVDLPVGRITAVTGVSGSGKSTLVLEGLVPALTAAAAGEPLPAHVTVLDAPGLGRVNLVDATPIGVNVRSTVATYSGVLDDLRREYAKVAAAKDLGLKAGAFSYNTGSLRCPRCEGTGQVSLDVQFLPDVDIECPACLGRRYAPEAWAVRWPERPAQSIEAGLALPDLLALSVREAVAVVPVPRIAKKLRTLADLGLGYLTLGEATPALSGGEAQRLKLAGELGRDQSDAVFVLDEPSVGLHPKDVRILLDVLQRLVDRGATVVVVEHDLDLIANADHVIDLGPGGGAAGGTVVAQGTPEQVAATEGSVTGRFLRGHLEG